MLHSSYSILMHAQHANGEKKTGAYDLPRPMRTQKTHRIHASRMLKVRSSYRTTCHAEDRQPLSVRIQPSPFSISAFDALVQTGLDCWVRLSRSWPIETTIPGAGELKKEISKQISGVQIEDVEQDTAAYSVNGKEMILIKRLFDHLGETGRKVRWLDLIKVSGARFNIR